jgi:membrane protein DedA with SNARE-associated domain
MESVLEWVAANGYGALFLLLVLGVVGLPIPDETLLTFCGYLISRGTMHPVLTYLTGVAGTWCGISLSYYIGHTLGLGFVHRYGKYVHVTEERLNKVHAWFDRMGHWALFVGYFIVGVRHFTAIVAGTSKLEFRSFALYAWSGGAVWVLTFLSIGYVIGEKWRQIVEILHRYSLYGSIVIIAAAILVGWYKRRKQSTSKA